MGCRLGAAEETLALLQAFGLRPENLGVSVRPLTPPAKALTAAVENPDFVSVAKVHVEDEAVAGEDGARSSGPQHHLRHVLQI